MKTILQKTNYHYLILIIAACILYGNTLTNEYALDDSIVITDNKFVKKGTSGIKDLLSTELFTGFFGVQKNLVEGGRYRPLSLISFAIEYQIFGLNPTISHLFNLLFYILSALILYRVLRLLLLKSKLELHPLIPLLAALLWLIHPLHTEVVANIKGRDEIFSLLGALSTWFFSIQYYDKKKTKYLVGATLFFFLGLMSKEICITFLIIIPLSLYFFRETDIKKILFISLSLLIPTITFLLIRQSIISAPSLSENSIPKELMNDSFLNMSGAEKYATIIYTLIIYLKLLFIPYPLTFDYYPYHIAITQFSNPIVILSIAIHLLLIYIVTTKFTKKSEWAFIILLYALSFSIVSNILFPIGVFMNERFMYIPSIAWSLGLSLFINKLLKNPKIKDTIPYLLIGFIFLGFSFIVIERNRVWKNNYSLFTNDVKTSKNSAKSNTSAGGVIMEEIEKLDKIKTQNINEIKKAIQKTNLPNKIKKQLSKGNRANSIYNNIKEYRKTELNKAISYLEKAIEIHPSYSDALLLLGNGYYMNGQQYNKTWKAYEKILKQEPHNQLVKNNWLKILNTPMPALQKINYHKKFLHYNPKVADSYYQIGHTFGKELNAIDSSIVYLEKARKLKPKQKNILKDLGVAYGIQQNYEKSIELMQAAYKLSPNDAQLLINIGISYKKLGQNELAQSYFDKAQKK